MNTERKIKEQIEKLNQNLVAAEHYVAWNVNVRAFDWLHLSDWNGKSGHPLWMKKHMIPSTKRMMTERERALKQIASKTKERQLKERRRNATHA
jgi:hypothetical protein